MESRFIRVLSEESRNYRFMGSVSELSVKELERRVNIDVQHSMAFVATIDESGFEKQFGVCRYATSSENEAGELAITVADECQIKGLGTLLMTQFIDYARKQGINRPYSLDSAKYSALRKPAKDWGISTTHDPDNAGQVIYSLML